MRKNDYKTSAQRARKFRLNRCPVWVLQGFGSRKECPVMRDCPLREAGGACDGKSKTGGMGIDHPGVYVREDGNKEYVFRPYTMSEDEKLRLQILCNAFNLEVEYTDRCSYEGTKDVIVRMKLPQNCTYLRR